MKIGIIGAGAIGQAFARQVAKAGYELFITNSRGPESLEALVKTLGGNVKAGTIEEVAKTEIIFLAVPWKNIPHAVSRVSSWKGKIVIDPTNAIIMPGFQLPDLGGKNSSEVVAEMMQGAHVVKAFNTLQTGILAADPHQAGGQRVIFYSGDDLASKKTVATIIGAIGFYGIDLGKLSEGGMLQVFPGGPLPTLNLVKL